jgi:hypothetical protein
MALRVKLLLFRPGQWTAPMIKVFTGYPGCRAGGAVPYYSIDSLLTDLRMPILPEKERIYEDEILVVDWNQQWLDRYARHGPFHTLLIAPNAAWTPKCEMVHHSRRYCAPSLSYLPHVIDLCQTIR